MGATKIEWADLTFNPWHGCEKVSPACAHCYAEGQSNRFNGAGLWGAGHGFRFQSDSYWAKPLAWARTWPAKLGRRPRVFCASMADVFEERDELDEHRERLLELILRTPELDWLLLTKRPLFASHWLAKRRSGPWHLEPPPNIWMGVSIENARYTWRADVLREIPAAVRFISAEPLLGSLFDDARPPRDAPISVRRSAALAARGNALAMGLSKKPLDLTGIDWVIAGGESGHGARPSHPDWFRELRDACHADDPEGCYCDGHAEDCTGQCHTAFLFKQWGEWAPSDQCGVRNVRMTARRFQYESRRFAPDGTAYKATEPDLYSYPGMESLLRVGKRNAGRALDSRTWDEFPRSAVLV